MATFCLNSRTARPGFDGVLFQTGSFPKSASKRRPFPTAAEANDHGFQLSESIRSSSPVVHPALTPQITDGLRVGDELVGTKLYGLTDYRPKSFRCAE